MKLTEDMIRYPLTDQAGVARAPEITHAAYREQELRATRNQVVAERRARNAYACLALVGWVIALAAIGGAV